MSPYPRQMQGLGIPAGFVEAGQSDFFVPRGYAHVIANSRGTCGSEGTYDFWGPAEKTDLYDLIEWVAAQPWCNGQVGMIGVSYFAIEQYRAALQRPPHLRAIFPFSGSTDFYREAFWHGGMFCGRFVARFFAAIGMLSRKKDRFFRSATFDLLNKILLTPRIHQRLAAPHKDTLKVFEMVLRFPYDTSRRSRCIISFSTSTGSTAICPARSRTSEFRCISAPTGRTSACTSIRRSRCSIASTNR
jgi:putative CocE/NonD family hydrolase